MPATAGSIYQAALAAHKAGAPPNTDPQRANETFTQYVARMWGNELPPDIGATESDADYLARLASYQPAVPSVNVTASYALVAATAATATSATSATSASYAFSASYAP